MKMYRCEHGLDCENCHWYPCMFLKEVKPYKMKTENIVKLREIINEISMEDSHLSLNKRQKYESRILKLYNIPNISKQKKLLLEQELQINISSSKIKDLVKENQKWTNISDEIPKMFTTIIFWHPENKKVLLGRAMTDGVHIDGYVYKCTHWMYLPNSPKLNR